MEERAKTEEVTETFLAWPSRITGMLVSMPLSLKLVLLVLIALLPRALAFLQPQIITIDGTLYIKMAKLFSGGNYGGVPGTYFNLYAVMIFLVQRLIGDWELSGQLISITLGAFTIIPIFLLGRSLYSDRVGWFSALFYITLPNFIQFDISVLRDPTLWFFICMTLWLVWEGLKKNQALFFGLASISAGLGALTRVEGSILWAVLIFYIAVRKVPGISRKRKALSMTLFIFVFPVLLSPILFSVKKDTSQTALKEMTSFSLNFITAHTSTILKPQDPRAIMGQKTYDSLPQLSQDSLELASRHRIVLAISEVIHKFIKSANLLIVLILIGFWQREKEGLKSSDWYLLYVFAALFCMSVFYCRQVYYFSTRAGLTLVVPSLFFAGHGLDFIAERFSRGLNRLTSGWSFVKNYIPHLLTIFFIIVFLPQGIHFKRTDKFIQKEIGLWLRGNGYQGSVIMGPKKFIRLAFYADGTFLAMPDSWEKVVDSIQRNGVQIVVVDSCTIDGDCPRFVANWFQAGLFLLSGPEGRKGKCPIQIYGVRKGEEKTGHVK
jgi:hypothetical protein